MKIGYFADGPWSHNALIKFLEDPSLQILFICARTGSKDNILREIANKNNIQYFCGVNINSDSFLDKICKLDIDLYISMSFDQIFKKEILILPKLGTINCHAGKLPFYRGRNILNWALINDEKEFGITVHFIDFGIDTGDIIVQKCFEITDKDNYESLLKKAYIECPKLLCDAIKLIQTNQVNKIKQDDISQDGFYCKKRGPGDERINWNKSSRSIFNLIRGVSLPGPMASSLINGKTIRINGAEEWEWENIISNIPGTVIKIESNYMLIKTRDSFLKVTEWYFDGLINAGDQLL